MSNVAPVKIYTIGHSTRPPEALIALLSDADVELLVDVRAFPRSRSNPQFNAETLADALTAAGLGYRHMQALGGRRGAQQLGQRREIEVALEQCRQYAELPVGLLQ